MLPLVTQITFQKTQVMKYLFTFLFVGSVTLAYSQEALTFGINPNPTADNGDSRNNNSNLTPTESPKIEDLDILQFPTGSIVSKGLKVGEVQTWELATSANSETIEAVFDSKSAVSKELSDLVMTERTDVNTLNKAIVSNGFTYVRYNLENGPINKGDYITISSEPGVGMKAIESGFTVGVALENSDATAKPGLLKVRVMVRYERF